MGDGYKAVETMKMFVSGDTFDQHYVGALDRVNLYGSSRSGYDPDILHIEHMTENLRAESTIWKTKDDFGESFIFLCVSSSCGRDAIEKAIPKGVRSVHMSCLIRLSYLTIPDIIGFTIDSLWHTAAARGSNYSAGVRSLMCGKVDKIKLIEERFFKSINNPSYLPGSKTDKSFKEWVGIFKAIKELNR